MLQDLAIAVVYMWDQGFGVFDQGGWKIKFDKREFMIWDYYILTFHHKKRKHNDI